MLKKIKTLALVLVSAFFCVEGHASENKKFNKMAVKMSSGSKSPLISSLELVGALSDQNIIVLDSREKAEFEMSSIKGARYIGYKKFNLERVAKGLDKDKKIIVYCSVGYRSGKIADQLRSKGFNAHNLKGGIFGWVNKGLPVFNSDGQTKKVHGYNKKWSKWLKKGEVIYNE